MRLRRSMILVLGGRVEGVGIIRPAGERVKGWLGRREEEMHWVQLMNWRVVILL